MDAPRAGVDPTTHGPGSLSRDRTTPLSPCPRLEARSGKTPCLPSRREHDRGALPANACQRWRSLFVDEIEDLTITDDQWQTADNYTPHSNGIDTLAVAVPQTH